MVRLALADGKITSPERQLLREAGTTVGYSHHDIQQIVRRTQRELYQETRREVRAGRRHKDAP